MTKNTPATPLPWKVAQAGDPNNVPRIMSEKGGVAVLCVNRFLGDKGPSKEEIQQAGYIAHAANAYPKLVALARFYATQPMGGEASTLLRELGEE